MYIMYRYANGGIIKLGAGAYTKIHAYLGQYGIFNTRFAMHIKLIYVVYLGGSL